MEQPIKEKDLLEKVARKNSASRKEVENSIMGVWENMIRSPDPVVRKFAIAMKDHNTPPSPEKFIEYITAMARLESMIPFIKAGYSEQEYERLCETELASVLASKYEKTELFELSVEEFAKLREAGKI